MTFEYTPYIIPLIIAAAISGWVLVYALQRRSSPKAIALAVMAFAITEWLIGYIFEIAGADLVTKLFWGKSQYVGITLVSLSWAVFAYYHANPNKSPNPRNLILLSIIPVITILLAFTTEIHGLIWQTFDIERSGTFSALSVSYGYWFWVNFAYSYILLIAGTVLIIQSLRRTQGLYRGQSVALIISLAVPWIGNALYITGLSPIPNLDLTPFSFTITVAALAWGIFGFQLVNISPIARDLIVDNMPEGMIVVDQRGYVADINPAAGRMIGIPGAQAVGKSFAEVLHPWPHLIEHFRDIEDGFDQISIGEGEAGRHYEVHLSALRDRQNSPLGRIITIRAIQGNSTFQPSYVPKDTIIKEDVKNEIEIVPESKSTIPLIGWFINFISVPIKSDLPVPPEINPKWHQSRERAFTIILRYAAILGTLTVLVAPSFRTIQAGLPFAIIILLIWVLGIARNINFHQRTIVFLFLIYAMASVETYNFGYSVASFTLYLTLVVSATLLMGRESGLISLVITLITAGTFGLQIGSGNFLPVNAHEGIPVPGTIQRAITSLLAFTASATALITAVTILMESLNKAWQMETQSRNLLQQERDLLDLRVTERTHALAEARDEAIKNSNELRKYFQGIEQSGNSIVITDTQGTIEYANPRFSALTGYSLDEVMGKNPRILKSGLHDNKFYENMWQTISSGDVWQGEIRNRRKDGSFFWESATIAPVQNHLGEITNYIAVKENITTRKELQEQLSQQNEQMAKEISERMWAEARLKESESRFRQIVENAGDIIYRVDIHGHFTYVNPTTMRILRIDDEADIIGKPYTDFATTEARQELENIFDEQYAAQTASTYYEFLAITRDGREIWLGQNVQLTKEGDEITGFQAVARDITDIKQAQDALALARDQALDASRLKSQLLSRVSHELRTPLGSVIGYAELLRDGVFGPLEEEQLDSVSQIVESGNYLAALVNDLLDEAQISSKNLTLNLKHFTPGNVLHQLHKRMLILAQSKGLTFNTDIVSPFPDRVYGDEKRIQQILVNLTGNAIKFTKTGGVDIRLFQPDNNHWCIQVVDTGAGIPREAQGLIFEPFRQVDNSITRENRGTGLGLSIVKQLVEIMDGEIVLESEPGKGSTFTITLPFITPKEEIS